MPRCCWRSPLVCCWCFPPGSALRCRCGCGRGSRFCAGWALFLRAPQALRRWGLLAGVIVYLVVLFICQRNFLAGAQQCAGNIAQSLNARLGSALPVAQGRQCRRSWGCFCCWLPCPLPGRWPLRPSPPGADALLLDSDAAARCCAAGAGRGRACCARLPAAVGRLDGAWAASCSVQRRALWGRRDTRKLPPEPLPPL